jgi:lipopolysaccharide/colanic/teichoic acid biosynthesis glycosyltransferase
MIDVLLVLLSMPVALPLIAVFALLVMSDGGPAFFKQSRIGRGRQNFSMWKLRTMVSDAEERLEAHLASNQEAAEEWANKQKLALDPRVTPIGRILRKYSLDELPQLFNVLSGDMSLVGPRPMCPHQRDMYPRSEYYTMRPGITGLWQVSERNLCSFSERAHYDSEYASTLGFGVDMRILWRTTTVVLRGTGL